MLGVNTKASCSKILIFIVKTFIYLKGRDTERDRHLSFAGLFPTAKTGPEQSRGWELNPSLSHGFGDPTSTSLRRHQKLDLGGELAL